MHRCGTRGLGGQLAQPRPGSPVPRQLPAAEAPGMLHPVPSRLVLRASQRATLGYVLDEVQTKYSDEAKDPNSRGTSPAVCEGQTRVPLRRGLSARGSRNSPGRRGQESPRPRSTTEDTSYIGYSPSLILIA